MKGAERTLSSTPAGAPATYQGSAVGSTANVLYIPRGESGVEVYDLSSPGAAAMPVNTLMPTGARYSRALTQGANLIAFEAAHPGMDALLRR